MQSETIQIVEIIGGLLGAALFISRLYPQLRRFIIVIQIAILLHKFLSKYLKQHPEQRQKLKIFILQVFKHYSRTHPNGKNLSRKTDFNEEINKMLGIELHRAHEQSKS